MHSRLPRGLALVVVAVMTVGCAKTLDTSGLEQTLRQQLEAQLGQRLSVSCPTGPQVKAGTTFQCVVAGPGSGTLMVEVTEKDDKGSVTWEILGASIPGSATPLTPTPTPTPTP
ncbi:MAG: DUF4333 domain-containing protein [Actinomycetota bacterium]|nr:DUF4333 domain-containing protein [Actinomycetota bacterium]